MHLQYVHVFHDVDVVYLNFSILFYELGKHKCSSCNVKVMKSLVPHAFGEVLRPTCSITNIL